MLVLGIGLGSDYIITFTWFRKSPKLSGLKEIIIRIVCFTLLAVSCLCYMLGKLKLEIPEAQTMANAGKGWRSPR